MRSFFNATATTQIYTLSLHDALPISPDLNLQPAQPPLKTYAALAGRERNHTDDDESSMSFAVYQPLRSKPPGHRGSGRACGRGCDLLHLDHGREARHLAGLEHTRPHRLGVGGATGEP